MRRASTPTVTVTAKNVDLTGCTVRIAIESGNKVIKAATVSSDGTDSVCAARLTHADSLALKEGRARIQLHWIDTEGHEHQSSIATAAVKYAIDQEVIE